MAEVRQLYEEIRRFVSKEVEPRSRWIDEHDQIPADLLQKTRALGLSRLTIWAEYGEIGLNLTGKCAVEEMMAKSNHGFTTVVGNHTGISTRGVVELGNEQQKRKYLAAHGDGK